MKVVAELHTIKVSKLMLRFKLTILILLFLSEDQASRVEDKGEDISATQS